ncbi:MAG TPA: undecaprenyl diphosphate synthase family protein, partial [Gammaproteobacteria bacterium]|nr:undecaprenyl diphosphate synthase family protein [Gammaproteobacteria bacterium]
MAAPAFARRQSATLRRIHLLGRQLRRVLTRPLYGVYERHLEQEVARGMVPAHLGMILDGNRRYARSLGIDARLGHHFGVDRLIEVLDWCAQTGIRHVTLFVFSNDNFSRPPQEVEYLMDLFVKRGPTILKDPRLRSHGVRIR